MKAKIKVKELNIVSAIKPFFYRIWKILKKIIVFLIKYIILPFLFLMIFVTLPIMFEKIINILIMNKIITANLDSSYLNFYVTILSGMFTLIGVVITIKHENNVKKNDEVITYKPILAIDGIDKHINCSTRKVGLGMPFYSSRFDSERDKKQEQFYQQQNNNNPKYRLLVKNKGRGETFNAILDSFELASINWDKDTNLDSNHASHQYIGAILKDEYLGIDVSLPDYLFMPKETKGVSWYELRTNTFISYSDMFDKIRYQYCIHTVHKVIVEKFEETEPYHYKDDFKYTKVRYEIMHIMPEMRVYSKKHKKFIHEHKYVTEKIKYK